MRPCQHGDKAEPAHTDDHVDVFLGTFSMDHKISLERRLELEPYTLSLADLLLTKLQIFRLNEKDLRDIVTILADTEVAEQDGPGMIDAGYIGKLCGEDWGLFYDVAKNLQRVDEGIAGFGLSDAQVARAHHGVLYLIVAIDDAPKSLRFRMRARIGTRKTWHGELDGQE